MASLANQTISSTYDGLIKTSTDQPVPISGVQLLEDGVGNSLALSVGRANQGVTVTGTLTATSITGVLADGVTATTQTLGDNSTKVATTAYVDAQVTASDLDFAGDSGTGAVDLDSQSLTIAGTANEIETVASGQTVTIGLPSSVTVGTLNATTLGGTLSTAAQPNITSLGTLSGLTVSGADSNFNATTGANANIILRRNSANLRDASIYFLDESTFQWNIGSTSDNALRFFKYQGGTSEAMRIDSAGNVGIGGTADSDYRIHLYKSTNSEMAFESTGTNGGFYRIGTGHDISGFGGAFRIYDVNAAAERMRINSSGNVGIGTSSPAQLLDVNGIADINSIIIGSNGDSINKAGNLFIQTTTASDLILRTNSTERMRIDSSGNVGIGTSSPITLGLLSVVNGSGTYTQTLANSNAFSTFPLASQVFSAKYNSAGTYSVFSSIYGGKENATDGDRSGILRFQTATSGGTETERMRITSGGDVLIGTTSSSGSASNVTRLSGGIFSTANGSIGLGSSGVAYTIFTIPASLSAWLVTINVSAGATSYSETALINVNNSAVAVTLLSNGGNVAISNSGLNIQATQSSGANQNIYWNAIRIA